MADRALKATEFLEETILLLKQLDSSAILRAEQILLHCYHRHGRVYTLGNGGSASTAQHFACDLARLDLPDQLGIDLLPKTRQKFANLGWGILID